METFISAVELAEAIRSRRIGVREALEAYLDRIAALNPAVNAIITLDADGARKRADEADRALANGESWGVLHGVPFTLKDGLATEGMRTTVGYSEFADYVPQADSAVAARLKAAGGILLGKTNVPPMLMSGQTQNDLFGRTNNPWNPDRTAGGSSGGAAAAVAAGLTGFDVGSDMAGSIRMPAHYCGVFGLKPTANRFPMTGHIPPAPDQARVDRHMAVVGPLARSVDDLELVASVLAGPDGADTEVPPVPWRTVPDVTLDRLRIGYLPKFSGVPTARSVSGAVQRVADGLAKAGATVDQREPGASVDAMNAVWRDYFPAIARTMMELAGITLPVKTPDGPLPLLKDWVLVLEKRDALIRAMDAFFRDHDAFLCPVGISPAFPHGPPGTPIPVDGESVESRYMDHYLYWFNMTGHPTVVLPAGLSEDNLPVGVQLVGRRWEDEKLLATARAIAPLAGGYRAPPSRACLAW